VKKRSRGAEGALGEGTYQAKAHHSGDARGRACSRGSSRQETIWTISEAMVPEDAEIAVGGWLRRDRHEFASSSYMGSRSPWSRCCRRFSRGDAEIAGSRASASRTGHQDLSSTKVTKLEKKQRQRGRHHRRRQGKRNGRVRAGDFLPSAWSAISENLRLESSASRPIEAASSSTATADQCAGIYAIGDSRARDARAQGRA